jgi:hypothetical protein
MRGIGGVLTGGMLIRGYGAALTPLPNVNALDRDRAVEEVEQPSLSESVTNRPECKNPAAVVPKTTAGGLEMSRARVARARRVATGICATPVPLPARRLLPALALPRSAALRCLGGSASRFRERGHAHA